jgi:2-polyprenyl-6-hydroxyphenyl methylase/3-demethylubiquinone-9 3-methyltransferase
MSHAALVSMSSDAQFHDEVRRGERFTFGSNWASFLETLNDARIAQAEQSLKDMLRVDSLEGLRFLDAGSGSGLFSLAAKRLGAQVVSFDFDPQSVACTAELRRRYFPESSSWSVQQASVLDRDFLKTLGQFDVVYSWGVLHHTGRMWDALANVEPLVKPGGRLFIALYNDEGFKSRVWTWIKKFYCSGLVGRWLVKAAFLPLFTSVAIAKSIVTRRNYFTDYKNRRGMSVYHDWIDWIGGYPFEVAKVEEILEFYRPHGFTVDNLRTTNRLGCNQFVFVRGAATR